MVTPFGHVYRGKRVLVTGHTGFKGGWISLWLQTLGAQVCGFSLPPPPGDSLFSLLPEDWFEKSFLGDVRDPSMLHQMISETRADIIFHLAAQPIVGASYRNPVDTFTTNALGTAMLLEAVREVRSPAAIVVVTSDKCYRNDNSGRPFVETDPLGGHDIYSMSKAATEMVVASWHASFFSKEPGLGPLATGRAGNVIGGGDYAEDRIVPDAVRAYEKNLPLMLRSPQSTRPWQHVLESVSGYLALGQRLLQQPEKTRLLNFNFGPNFEAERTVHELMDAWLAAWPEAFALGINPAPAYPEAARLSLNHSKAKTELGWMPVWNFKRTVEQTAAWYQLRHGSGADQSTMLNYTLGQITAYTEDAHHAGAAWII